MIKYELFGKNSQINWGPLGEQSVTSRSQEIFPFLFIFAHKRKSLWGNLAYILKVVDLRDRSLPIFFIFRQNLGWECENHQDYTAPMPLHPFVVFAAWLPLTKFYIDLLYFVNSLMKTPDLCNLRAFVAICFCRNLRSFSANFWRQINRLRQFIHF